MEVRRILTNYRIYALIALILGAVALGTYFELENNHIVRKYSDIVNQEYDIELLKKEVEELYVTDPLNADIMDKAVRKLWETEDYLRDFYTVCDRCIERAIQLKAKGKVGDYDKVIADFERISNVKVEMGNDYAVTLITDNNIINIMLIVMAVIIPFFFFDERKLGMWDFVYSTRNGRGHLAFTRCVMGSALMAVAGFMAYIICIAVSIEFTGIPQWERSIQSIECFGQFPIALNVFEFLILFGIIKIAGAILIFLIFFLIFSAVSNRSIAMLVSIIVVSAEFILYKMVPGNSHFEFLKFWNIYFAGFGIEDYTVYKNYIIADSIVLHRLTVRVIVVAVFSLLAGGGAVLVNQRKKPAKNISVISCIFSMRAVGKFIEKLPNWMVEYRKMYFWCRGIIVIIMVMVAGIIVNPATESSYKDSTARLKNMYDLCGGDVDAAEKLLTDLKDELAATDDNESMKKALLLEDINSFESKLDYTKKMQAGGIAAEVVDEKPYTVYFSRKSSETKKLNIFVVMVGMVLVYSNLFDYERKSNVMLMVNSTKNGRKKLICDKFILVIISSFIMMFLTIGRNLFNFGNNYGFPYFDKMALNVSIFSDVSQNVSIGDVVVMEILITGIFLLLVGVFIFVLSLKTDYKKTILIFGVVIILPALFEILGMDWAKYISVSNLCNITNYF